MSDEDGGRRRAEIAGMIGSREVPSDERAARTGTLRSHAHSAVLAAMLALSGCIAGTVVRQWTWERDPSPF